jgi:hypothetical protein
MKTAHRRASHAKRAEPSKFWQPAITAAKVSSCKLAHWDAFGRLTRPQATQIDLMDWVEAGLTYTELMRLLEADGTEFTPEAKAAMAENNAASVVVLARFKTKQLIGFNSEQLLAARAACEVMDLLIEMDRFGFAVRAALWSNAQMARLQLAREHT